MMVGGWAPIIARGEFVEGLLAVLETPCQYLGPSPDQEDRGGLGLQQHGRGRWVLRTWGRPGRRHESQTSSQQRKRNDVRSHSASEQTILRPTTIPASFFLKFCLSKAPSKQTVPTLLQLVLIISAVYASAVAATVWGVLKSRRAVGDEAPAAPVTVIVAARNERSSIGRCVRSILDQGHRDLRLIVADDRSEDNTADLAGAAADGDPRLTVLRIPGDEPGGKKRALLRGIEAGEVMQEDFLF